MTKRLLSSVGGERGIRTPGPVTVNGFQDRRIRPLCHFSGGKSTVFFESTKRFNKKKVKIFLPKNLHMIVKIQ